MGKDEIWISEMYRSEEKIQTEVWTEKQILKIHKENKRNPAQEIKGHSIKV